MPMKFVEDAIKLELPSMNKPGSNAFLDDVIASTDPEKTIVAGFFRMEKSDTPLEYFYHYHEMKIIVEGEMLISDETGHQVHAKVGDVLYFEKGSTITFQSPSVGIGFFCGQRLEGDA
ncbi:cupin domain-containing protein [Marinobacterium sediminicola]|uniref:Ethanolamine utilisation protein EutQ n=1 Tax=Marinobacterium sediminicola TaxID=518898 RepID=A0ABY1S1P0_9GAMM|nr:cupin domain-containing protein [Marinobacterium sediminicola]ULG69449.1 cupin domain-containing protein [Marinobacterium sediminicola]SMR75599.1 Ethanolamine utilisation protein EutQ [Marinobacterium sediminicola]